MISTTCEKCEYREYCRAEVFVDKVQWNCLTLLISKSNTEETETGDPQLSVLCDRCVVRTRCPYKVADQCPAWRQAFRQQHSKENRLDIRGKDFSTRSKRHHARKQELPVPYVVTVGNMDSVRWGDGEYGSIVDRPED